MSSAQIPQDQIDLLKMVLNQITYPEVIRVINSQREHLWITRGVHVSNYSSDITSYHFNIRIGGITYHIYVQPVTVQNPSGGISIDNNGSVTLSCETFMLYQFVDMTYAT